MKKICLVDNNASMLINFRLDFIKELCKIYQVYVVCPINSDEQKSKLTLAGVVKCVDNPFMKRKSINPLDDIKLYLFYRKQFSMLKPDMVFNYTIKCCIWSSLAAKHVEVQNIYSMVTGLGYAFTNLETIKTKIINKIASKLYHISLRLNSTVFFLNPDDAALFTTTGIIKPEKAVVLNGEGVDLEHFDYTTSYPSVLTFVFVGRLLKDKGIVEYYEAARILKKIHGDSIKFVVAGERDDNPASITKTELNTMCFDEVLDYLGFIEDVRPAILNASVFVLPSYREGTPISILEAMAMGRPIITTDTPGCKETVIQGVNGYLVKIKDVDELKIAMEKFIQNPELIKTMGKASRNIAENKYNVHTINKQILEIIAYKSILNQFILGTVTNPKHYSQTKNLPIK